MGGDDATRPLTRARHPESRREEGGGAANPSAETLLTSPYVLSTSPLAVTISYLFHQPSELDHLVCNSYASHHFIPSLLMSHGNDVPRFVIGYQDLYLIGLPAKLFGICSWIGKTTNAPLTGRILECVGKVGGRPNPASCSDVCFSLFSFFYQLS